MEKETNVEVCICCGEVLVPGDACINGQCVECTMDDEEDEDED